MLREGQWGGGGQGSRPRPVKGRGLSQAATGGILCTTSMVEVIRFRMAGGAHSLSFDAASPPGEDDALAEIRAMAPRALGRPTPRTSANAGGRQKEDVVVGDGGAEAAAGARREARRGTAAEQTEAAAAAADVEATIAPPLPPPPPSGVDGGAKEKASGSRACARGGGEQRQRIRT